MGAFNTVMTRALSPCCKTEVDVVVQFKYGDKWQHEYKLGDTITWGGNDDGIPGQRHVVVDGVAQGPCPSCGSDPEWDFEVHLKNDVIDAVRPASGAFDFAQSHFIVLES